MESKKTSKNFLVTALSLLLSATIGLISVATVALYKISSSSVGTFPGTVGLRSYFQKGTGTYSDPFVISRPSHFFNLTRLQNLGVFDKVYYFALGYDPDNPNDVYGANSTTDLKFYPNNSTTATSDMIDYLNMGDMSASGSGYTFLSIGTEGTPFYGVFNGNKKVVKGLNIHSDPDDVGVFGYTNSASVIKDVCFQDLSITDDGYSTQVSGLSTLYDQTYTSLNTAGASMVFSKTSGDITLTNVYQDLGSFTKENVASDTEPSFTLTTPTLSATGISYVATSSGEYLTVSDNANGTFTINVNRAATDGDNKKCIENNEKFYEVDGAVLSTRVSLIGRVFKDGIFYSHVLQTYKIIFTNKVVSSTEHTISMKALIDYVNPSDNADSTYTEYNHGVNIGFIAGHCDGSASYCYVYNGSLHMNTTTSNVTNLAQKTETGLIGCYGVSINNQDTPKSEYATTGDTGVVNFSKIYSDIVGSSGFTSKKNGNSTYYIYTPTNLSTNKFATYLRTDGSTANDSWGNAVTNAEYSVDFAGRQVIQDDTDVNRNLGVFKLTSSNYDTKSNPSASYLQGLGEFNVSHSSSTTFDEFYYTTAEWKNPSNNTNLNNSNTWSYDFSSSNPILLATHMPSYSDSSTWSPELERYTNFIVRCPLSSSANYDYFYNSTGFMQSYFSYKLIDKTGSGITPGTKDFGVFVKNVDLEAKTTSNITSFDSTLKLSASSSNTISTFNKTVDGTTYTYPVNSINFSVKSEKGANVTVMASSKSGSGGYVGIYDASTNLASGKAYAPSYAMYLPYSYTGNIDKFAYFDYNYSTGVISSTATRADCGEKLFAHTFKLPKGDYFIASPNGSAYVYYVCAQGQEHSGNIGDTNTAFSALNVISNVDFVSQAPTKAQFEDETAGWGRCFLSFSANFTSSSGYLSLASVYNTSTSKPTTTFDRTASGSLTDILIDNSLSYPVVFDGTTYEKRFISWSST